MIGAWISPTILTNRRSGTDSAPVLRARLPRTCAVRALSLMLYWGRYMALLDGLNPEQQQAVTHDTGPLLIVAGAGTGKTTVITRRIAYLIEQGKAEPDQILALTFTDKAAGEMEERIDKLLPYGYTDLWVQTFHAFGEKLLHRHALDIGVPYDFKLVTETEQWLLVRQHLDRFQLSYYRSLGNPTKFIHALVRHFSRAKDEEIYPEHYLAYAESLQLNSDTETGKKTKKKKTAEPTDASEAARIMEVANAYHVYQQLLLEQNALDFGDLINYTLRLLRTRPDILAKYRAQFKYILVDEFQDTNWAQYELVKLLAAPDNNISVVGDDDQSIYRFRGASMSNIMQFKQDYPTAAEAVLVHNYRSAQNILDLSHAFIRHNNPNRLEEKYGINKALRSSATELAVIAHLHGETVNDEYQLIVEKIASLKAADPKLEWHDFAVLARSNDQANQVALALHQAGVPYQSFTSKGLYAKPIIIDVLAYLRLLDNYHESTALWRVLNFPFWNMPMRELVELSHYAHRKSWSLFEAIEKAASIPNLSAGTVAALQNITEQLREHARFSQRQKPTEVFVAAMHDIGYTKHIESLGDAMARLEFSYLNQFYQRMQRWEETQLAPRLRDFLDTITFEIESGEEGSLQIDPDIGPDVVRVMTVHAAKGLEFTYVFIVGLVDRRFPTTERGEPIAMPEALVKEIIPEGDAHLEEERRLMYVAITRAKRGLFFTSAEDYGGARKKKLSRFMTELGIALSAPVAMTTRDVFASKPAAAAPVDLKPYLPSAYSFTQLKAFETCPFQYRFAHVLKVPVWGRHTFSFGQSMHLTLERFFLLRQERAQTQQPSLFGEATASVDPTLDDLMRIFDESWIDDWYKGKKQAQEYKEQGRQILKEFYTRHEGKWPDTKYLERGFSLKIGPYTIRGQVDRIDARDGGVEIIDYKTGKVPASLDDVDKDQLLIYQMAAEVIWREKPVALTFYYLTENKPMSFLASPDDLTALQQKIVHTIDAIQKGDFVPDPEPNKCKFCDFKDICEYRKL